MVVRNLPEDWFVRNGDLMRQWVCEGMEDGQVLQELIKQYSWISADEVERLFKAISAERRAAFQKELAC